MRWPIVDKTDVRVREVEAFATARDHECAHAAEDTLWRDVLIAVAAGRLADPRGCAKLALRTRRLKFPRHCS